MYVCVLHANKITMYAFYSRLKKNNTGGAGTGLGGVAGQMPNSLVKSRVLAGTCTPVSVTVVVETAFIKTDFSLRLRKGVIPSWERAAIPKSSKQLMIPFVRVIIPTRATGKKTAMGRS